MYIYRLLGPEEKIVYLTRMHVITFLPTVIIFVAAFLAWCFLPDVASLREPIFRGLRFFNLATLALLLGGVVSGIRCAIDYFTSVYVVTNQRVFMKRGWLVRRVVEVFLSRIEGITLRQSFLGQLFNYATVEVIGTGGTSDFYLDVPNPEAFHRVVQQQMPTHRATSA